MISSPKQHLRKDMQQCLQVLNWQIGLFQNSEHNIYTTGSKGVRLLLYRVYLGTQHIGPRPTGSFCSTALCIWVCMQVQFWSFQMEKWNTLCDSNWIGIPHIDWSISCSLHHVRRRHTMADVFYKTPQKKDIKRCIFIV